MSDDSRTIYTIYGICIARAICELTSETVSGGLRPNSLTRKVLSEKIANETSLSYTVLTNKEDLWFGFVCINKCETT